MLPIDVPQAATTDSGTLAEATGTTVLVAIQNYLVQSFVCEILRRDCLCEPVTRAEGEMLVDALQRCSPDVLVVDTGDFPACCRDALRTFPRARVVVIGPEPSTDYRRSAIDVGAGGWIPRDRVAEDLPSAISALHLSTD